MLHSRSNKRLSISGSARLDLEAKFGTPSSVVTAGDSEEWSFQFPDLIALLYLYLHNRVSMKIKWKRAYIQRRYRSVISSFGFRLTDRSSVRRINRRTFIFIFFLFQPRRFQSSDEKSPGNNGKGNEEATCVYTNLSPESFVVSTLFDCSLFFSNSTIPCRIWRIRGYGIR